MRKTQTSPLAKFIARQVFLDFYLLLNLPDIRLRARLGNPAAIQILDLDRRFQHSPTSRHYEDLHIAIDEYRRALLN